MEPDGSASSSQQPAPKLAQTEPAPEQRSNGGSDALRIAIIGSGLAALSAAIFLEKERERLTAESRKRLRQQDLEGNGSGTPSSANAPWTATLYERDESWESRRDGYGLTLKYDPNSVLEKLGVLEELCRLDCPSRSHYELARDGTVTGYYGNAFVDEPLPLSGSRNVHDEGGDSGHASPSRRDRGYGQRGNLRVPRQLVRRAMIGRLKATRVEWGHRLVRLEVEVEAVPRRHNDDPGGINRRHANGRKTATTKTMIRCCFANGSSVLADWVLGADGVRSTVVQQHSALLSSHLLHLQRARKPVCDGNVNIPTPAPPAARDPPLHRLGIRLIVGLATLGGRLVKDPKYRCLLDERGFYTLAHESRLFVMPYSSPTPLHPDRPRQYMWQLSFREHTHGDPEDGLTTIRTYNDPQSLLNEAVARCEAWHEPVPSLLQSTPTETVWSASLYDRDPYDLCQHWEALRQRIRDCSARKDSDGSGSLLFAMLRPLPIVALGDAMHAMSCFKGQGAHQALKDGQCASRWLVKAMTGRCSVESAVTALQREIVQRTRSVVLDSRMAADDLHRSSQESCGDCDGSISHSTLRRTGPVFAGVPGPLEAKELLQRLDCRGVRAGATPDLDGAIGRVLDEVHYARAGDDDPTGSACRTRDGAAPGPCLPPPPISWTQSVLTAARNCDLAELRRLSWVSKDARWMPASADGDGNTCLHLAAGAAFSSRGGEDDGDDDAAAVVDVDVARVDRSESLQWLVREAGCSCRAMNRRGQVPIDLVDPNGDGDEFRRLLRALDLQQHQQEEHEYGD